MFPGSRDISPFNVLPALDPFWKKPHASLCLYIELLIGCSHPLQQQVSAPSPNIPGANAIMRIFVNRVVLIGADGIARGTTSTRPEIGIIPEKSA
jgi:hypothetical protein